MGRGYLSRVNTRKRLFRLCRSWNLAYFGEDSSKESKNFYFLKGRIIHLSIRAVIVFFTFTLGWRSAQALRKLRKVCRWNSSGKTWRERAEETEVKWRSGWLHPHASVAGPRNAAGKLWKGQELRLVSVKAWFNFIQVKKIHPSSFWITSRKDTEFFHNENTCEFTGKSKTLQRRNLSGKGTFLDHKLKYPTYLITALPFSSFDELDGSDNNHCKFAICLVLAWCH